MKKEIQEIPHSIEIEQQILAQIIVDDKVMNEVIEIIAPEMFYNDLHRNIYIAMIYSHKHHIKITYATLIERLKVKGFGNDDELNYLLELSKAFVSKSQFEGICELLIDIYRKRELYKVGEDLTHTNLQGFASGDIVNKIEKTIEGMGITSNIEVEKFEDYIDTWLEYQEDDTPIKSYKLGFQTLDETVLLEEGNLMIIGARPSVGKSAFATNLVKNFCLQGYKPLFVSLEMTKREYMNRLVSNMAHIKARKLKRKEYKTPDEWKRIKIAKEKIKKFKFNFYDKGNMKIEMLLGLCKYLKKQDELDVLVVDYLQLLESNQYKGQKQNQVGYISQKLKQIAMELSIPVIALSQLSRGSIEHGKPREPQLSDLRDSGK